MRHSNWLRLVFVTVALLLGSTLGWLTWRLLEQEQQLWAQRAVERNEASADLVALALERKLTAIERSLDRVLTDAELGKEIRVGDHAAVLHVSRGVTRVWPEHGLVYVPVVRDAAQAQPDGFSAADRLEFQKQDYAGAIALLRVAAATADANVRAAALVRLGRNYFKSGLATESLACYEQLRELGGVSVAGMPAALAARAGMLAVYENRKDRAGVARAAQALHHDLHKGSWPITFATYAYLAEQSSGRIDSAEPSFRPRVALAEGVDWLWQNVRSGSGRRDISTPSGSVLLVWRSSSTASVGFVGNTEYLREILGNLATAEEVTLISPEGRPLWSSRTEPAGRPAIRLASSTQLPWTLQVFTPRSGQELAVLRGRRRLLIGGMCAMLTVIVAGGWFASRAVARELAVARLQSDFVAAVSHEFRTPLTTLCQLSELLMRGRVTIESDKNEYYGLLYRESQRLRRLIESVLDFGRLERGRMQFRFERLNISETTELLAAEFAAQPQSLGHRVEVEAHNNASAVSADREALRCVLWNLLENAAKYSPDCDRVRVELASRGQNIEIAVRDWGMGILPSEQRRIFEKFVRGKQARESNIRGTGIGLAIARQIVHAHGGEITVESKPGNGSTFRVLLPQMD